MRAIKRFVLRVTVQGDKNNLPRAAGARDKESACQCEWADSAWRVRDVRRGGANVRAWQSFRNHRSEFLDWQDSQHKDHTREARGQAPVAGNEPVWILILCVTVKKIQTDTPPVVNRFESRLPVNSVDELAPMRPVCS